MTDRVFVAYDDETGMPNGKGNFVATLEEYEEIKEELEDAELIIKDCFTFTFISNKEYLVLVKLGLVTLYQET